MDTEVPKIKPAFVKTMIDRYGDTEKHANEVADHFIQVFMDAVNYGFSVNHSIAYSYVGYIATWLRYYYPLEFCTAAFEIWKDDQAKINKVSKYAKQHGITIEKARFGKSKGLYFMDKATNTIYEGTASIKGNNAQVGNDLYEISKMKKYDNFLELLLIIADNSYVKKQGKEISILNIYNKCSEEQLKDLDKQMKQGEIELVQNKFDINKTKMLSLIRLDYFKPFGNSKALEDLYLYFNKNYKPKNKTLIGKSKKFKLCQEYQDKVKDNDFTFMTKLEYEIFYTGKCTGKDPRLPAHYAIVMDVKKSRTRTRAVFHQLKTGEDLVVLVGSKTYREVPFKGGDLVSIQKAVEKPKSVFVDGQWTKHPTDKDVWVQQLKFIRKGGISK